MLSISYSGFVSYRVNRSNLILKISGLSIFNHKNQAYHVGVLKYYNDEMSIHNGVVNGHTSGLGHEYTITSTFNNGMGLLTHALPSAFEVRDGWVITSFMKQSMPWYDLIPDSKGDPCFCECTFDTQYALSGVMRPVNVRVYIYSVQATTWTKPVLISFCMM